MRLASTSNAVRGYLQISDSVSTSYQKRSIVRHSDAGFEDDGRVIRNQVDSTNLLHELAADTKQSPVAEALGTVLEKCLEIGAAGNLLLLVQCVLNDGHLVVDDFRILANLVGVGLQAP